MRISAGANAWRKVEGVMGDGHISRKHKGNVVSPCVMPAYMNALETMALTEIQEKIRFAKNNLVRIIVSKIR